MCGLYAAYSGSDQSDDKNIDRDAKNEKKRIYGLAESVLAGALLIRMPGKNIHPCPAKNSTNIMRGKCNKRIDFSEVICYDDILR